MNKFIYFSKPLEANNDENNKVFFVNKKIENKNDLFASYQKELRFPDYFGYNWDALYDCLNDLSWIKEKIILIIHEDLPFPNSLTDRKTYIELLVDSINHGNNNQHELDICFPEFSRNEISTITNEYES